MRRGSSARAPSAIRSCASSSHERRPPMSEVLLRARMRALADDEGPSLDAEAASRIRTHVVENAPRILAKAALVRIVKLLLATGAVAGGLAAGWQLVPRGAQDATPAP